MESNEFCAIDLPVLQLQNRMESDGKTVVSYDRTLKGLPGILITQTTPCRG